MLDIVKGYSKSDGFTDERISNPYEDPIFFTDNEFIQLDVRWSEADSGSRKFYFTEMNADIFSSDKYYVIYKDVYNNITWIREYNEFLSEVDYKKHPYATQRYRFEKIN